MAYVRPVRNPLQRLPVRAYRSPLRSRLPGMGDAPIDIGTSATVDVTPSGATVTGQGASAGYTATTPAPSTGITDWLNQNSSTLLWIGGVSIAVLLFSRMAR